MAAAVQKWEKDLELWITRLENTTTGTDLLKVKSDSSLHRASALLDKGVKVLIPEGSCPIGHFVIVDFNIQMRGRHYEMHATGKVIGEEKIANTHIVEIEFKSFDKKLWAQLFTLIHDRQDRVTELFQKIKGA